MLGEPTDLPHDANQSAASGSSYVQRRTFLRRFAYGVSTTVAALVSAACGQAPPAPVAEAPTTAPASPTQQPPTSTPRPSATLVPPTATRLPTATPVPATRLAVIGDYGWGGQEERDVATLVLDWKPDVIITTGDNNYPSGSLQTIDDHIGQFYQEYIYPYKGAFGKGSPTKTNRFFPSLGNHDWDLGVPRPYLDYFTLPDNERYYRFSWGPADFFALDSALDEPDGVRKNSKQAAWFQEQIAASTASWKIVYFHHPPFSSGHHGSSPWMQWPFQEWGASVVLTGHDHSYERFDINGLPYIVNGLGGGPRYKLEEQRVESSQIAYNKDHGALLIELTNAEMTFQFVTRKNEVIDTFSLRQSS